MPKSSTTAKVVANRRTEYADITRQAAVDAARELFGGKGYFATTVNEVAAAARVSPATVYSVNGGKQGLLKSLIDEWSDGSVVTEGRTHIEGLNDPVEIIRYLTSMTRRMRESYGDIMKLVLATAPHDMAAADGLAVATKRYRGFEAFVAKRLADLGALREGMSAKDATDLIWFYLGYAGFFTLVDDNRWSYAKAEQWLSASVEQAVLRPSLYRRK
jgi:AcrR family transcriptional regulator